MVTMICWSLVVVVVTGLLLCRLKQVYEMVWKNPIRIRSTLAKQGIGGPTPAFLYGNVKEIQIMESEAREDAKNVQELSHDHWVRAIFPHLRRWTFDYGKNTIQYSTIPFLIYCSMCCGLIYGPAHAS